MRRPGLTIAGVLLLLVGTVWFYQGIGVIPGTSLLGSAIRLGQPSIDPLDFVGLRL